MNRVRLLCDNVGFAHLSGTAKKREIINRLRKTRFQGKIPPAFPNGWYALAESREVFNENNAFTDLEYFPPLNSFRTFMYCDQRSQYIRPKSKKNSFRGNYMRKYGSLISEDFHFDSNLQKRCKTTPFLQVGSAQGRDWKLFLVIGVKVKKKI